MACNPTNLPPVVRRACGIAPKFSVFGDVGLAFSRGTRPPPGSLPYVRRDKQTVAPYAMRSGAGVILLLLTLG